jgi:Protein of unknown function (DUF2971)
MSMASSSLGSIPLGGSTNRPSVDTNALNAFLDSIKSYTPELIFGLNPGDLLCHYTDLQGLLGIITDHDLRLTHSLYLNDAEEMTHGYKAAEKVILDAKNMRNDPTWNDYLDQLAALLKKPLPQGVYVCCFCREDNLLSQWRGYGANGTGVSLSFDYQQFSFVTGPDSPHGGMMRIWKVFYDPVQQTKILNDAINFAFDNPAPGKTAAEDKARQAADAIEFFIPTFKNPDFIDENEWRLIFTPPPVCPVKPRFRAARGMLIPYYSLKELSVTITPTGHLPLVGLCIGPSANKLLNDQSVQMLLTQAEYSTVKTTASNTPYRG